MTGEKANFLSLAATHGGSVVVGNEKSGKNSEERSSTGPDSNTDQQASDQTGGTAAEPCLKQRSTEIPESGARTGTETGPRTISEPGSPTNQAEFRTVNQNKVRLMVQR